MNSCTNAQSIAASGAGLPGTSAVVQYQIGCREDSFNLAFVVTCTLYFQFSIGPSFESMPFSNAKRYTPCPQLLK